MFRTQEVYTREEKAVKKVLHSYYKIGQDSITESYFPKDSTVFRTDYLRIFVFNTTTTTSNNDTV